MDTSYFVKGTVDRFEGIQAIVKTDDGQELNWPIKNLPEDAKKGAPLRLVMSTSQTDQEERGKIAKTLLNQILGNAHR